MRATVVCVLAFMLACSEGYQRMEAIKMTGEMKDQQDTRLAAAKLFHKKNQAQVPVTAAPVLDMNTFLLMFNILFFLNMLLCLIHEYIIV